MPNMEEREETESASPGYLVEPGAGEDKFVTKS